MQRTLFPAICAALVAAGLAACSHPPAPAPQVVRPSGELVAAIRAAGARDHSVVHVVPLRNPAVKGLLDKAAQEESAHDFKAAADLLDQALAITPKAPGILQDRAELAVRLGHYARAEQFAMRSFRLGPKVGSLCARNWQTVLEMRRIAGDKAGVQAARKQLGACEERGPVRM